MNWCDFISTREYLFNLELEKTSQNKLDPLDSSAELQTYLIPTELNFKLETIKGYCIVMQTDWDKVSDKPFLDEGYFDLYKKNSLLIDAYLRLYQNVVSMAARNNLIKSDLEIKKNISTITNILSILIALSNVFQSVSLFLMFEFLRSTATKKIKN